MNLRFLSVAAGVTLLGSSAPQRPEVVVSSATVRVVRKAVPTQFVYVENRRAAPLVEWEFTLAPASRPDQANVIEHSIAVEAPDRQAGSAIRYAESRVHRLTAPDLSTQIARLTLVVFADGLVDGAAAAVTEFRRRQDGLVADLTSWQAALQGLPRQEAEALAHVRQQRDAALKARPDDVSGIRRQVAQLVEGARPRGWVFSTAESLREKIATRLATSTRYRDGADAALRSGSSLGTTLDTKATARAAAGQGFDLIAVVENQREAPLEAWEVVVYDGPALRFPRSESSHDACVSLGDQGIARGGSREVYLGPAEEAPPLPFAVLTMAIWADLSWEGDPEARAKLLRRREDEAGSIAFWVAALKAAEARASLADAVSYLTVKRDERRRLASDDGFWIEANLRSWTERSRSTPGAKTAELSVYRQSLERQHQLLTRHVGK